MNKSGPEQTEINALNPGDPVSQVCILRKIELKTKRNGDPYLFLELGDASGRIQATVWDNAAEIHNLLKAGDIVRISGKAMTYNQALRISVDHIHPVTEADGVSREQFLPATQADMQKLTADLKKTIASLKNGDLKNLAEAVFGDRQWLDLFLKAPGGKLWHHACIGGLLEHTMSVVRICETMAGLYPSVNRDLLIIGALLHDIGKIEEYRYDQGYIDYSDEGRLLGHISIGAQRIRSIIEQIEIKQGFPRELKHLVLHLILSHQGKLEHGSPVLPATLEAMILYYADEMDAKANGLRHILMQDKAPDQHWSRYIQILDRFIYLGAEGDSDTPEQTGKSPGTDRDDAASRDRTQPSLFD